MSRFDDIIQMPGLPAPKLIEEVDFDTLRDRQVAKFKELWPDFEDETEFEPVRAHFGADAYSEELLRKRINEAASAARLATATGKDLDIIGASRRRNIPRLILHPGDPTATPPVDPIYEDDEDYRERIQLSPESYSVAGPEGGYVYWARTIAGVSHATAVSPEPCDAVVTVLARDGDGTADAELLALVTDAVSYKKRRPIGDRVTVQSATVENHTLEASLSILEGPSPELVLAEAQTRFDAYLASRRRIGRDLPTSGLHSALSVAGVEKVTLLVDGQPIGDEGIAVAADGVIHLTSVEIKEAGV